MAKAYDHLFKLLLIGSFSIDSTCSFSYYSLRFFRRQWSGKSNRNESLARMNSFFFLDMCSATLLWFCLQYDVYIDDRWEEKWSCSRMRIVPLDFQVLILKSEPSILTDERLNYKSGKRNFPRFHFDSLIIVAFSSSLIRDTAGQVRISSTFFAEPISLFRSVSKRSLRPITEEQWSDSFDIRHSNHFVSLCRASC